MPFKGHPEFAKLFGLLTAPTCAACLLQNADLSKMADLVKAFEHRAKRGKHLAHDFCHVCREFKAVICPA